MPAASSLPDPTCRSARTLLTPEAPGLSTAHIPSLPPPDTTVFSAIGGSLSTVCIPPDQPRQAVGGGKRGEITEFSRAARRRLLHLLNSLNKNEIKTLPLFVTLTYPAEFPSDPKTWKRHLDNFRARMRRKFGRFPAVWRLEFQKRGAPHFHLMLFLEKAPTDLYEAVSHSWYEVVGSNDPKHLAAGTNVQQVRSWRGVMSYAAKYMGKLEQLAPGVQSPGKFWGTWNKRDLPREFEEIPVSKAEAISVRRIYRKLSGVRPREALDCEPRSLTIFVNHSTTRRLLAHMHQSTEQKGSGYGTWKKEQEAARLASRPDRLGSGSKNKALAPRHRRAGRPTRR